MLLCNKLWDQLLSIRAAPFTVRTRVLSRPPEQVTPSPSHLRLRVQWTSDGAARTTGSRRSADRLRCSRRSSLTSRRAPSDSRGASAEPFSARRCFCGACGDPRG